jgi:hypothetical protein
MIIFMNCAVLQREVRKVMSRGKRWSGHLERMREKRNAYRIL